MLYVRSSLRTTCRPIEGHPELFSPLDWPYKCVPDFGVVVLNYLLISGDYHTAWLVGAT
jgi:hypothetical protein